MPSPKSAVREIRRRAFPAEIRHDAGVRGACRRRSLSPGIQYADRLEGRCRHCLHTPSSGGTLPYPGEEEIREERCRILGKRDAGSAPPLRTPPQEGGRRCPCRGPPPPCVLCGSVASICARASVLGKPGGAAWRKWRRGPHQLGKLVKVGLRVWTRRIFFWEGCSGFCGAVPRSEVTAS
jgi:hypothetical protein